MFIPLNVLMVFGALLVVGAIVGVRYVAMLQHDNREQQGLLNSLAERCNGQAELLSKRAEKKLEEYTTEGATLYVNQMEVPR